MKHPITIEKAKRCVPASIELNADGSNICALPFKLIAKCRALIGATHWFDRLAFKSFGAFALDQCHRLSVVQTAQSLTEAMMRWAIITTLSIYATRWAVRRYFGMRQGHIGVVLLLILEFTRGRAFYKHSFE